MDTFRLVYDIRFCRVDISCSGVQHLWFCFFCFCCVLFCVLFCVFVVAALVVLLVVLEFENGSREEEFCCFPCRSVAIFGWPVLRAWHLGLCG